jgi:putative aldouronate transport system substrate-binding protein
MKKLLALMLALVMALSVMSIASAEGEEPFEITVLLPQFPSEIEFVMDDNPILNYITEKTGVKLSILWGANSIYSDVLNTTLADKNMPMLLSVTDARAPIIIDSARAGAFWDITDYVQDEEEYPYLAAGSDAVYSNIAVDGKVYGIFRSRAFPRGGIYYRWDIANELGFDEVPTTIDELTELAEALATYKENTYALNMCSYTAGTISVITVAFGAPNVWGVNEDGDIYPAFQSPAYLEGLNWLRHLYEIGGIDPNFAQISTSEWDNIERTGKAYMRFDCMDNAHRQQEWFENNAGATEQIWMSLCGLEKEDGTITVWPQNPGFAGEVLVTKSVKEEDLPKVLKFLDWCSSPEGNTLLNAGLEGLTYEVNEDGYRYVPEGDDKYATNSGKYHNNLNQLSMGTAGENQDPPAVVNKGYTNLRERYNALNTEYAQYAVANPCTALISDTYVAYGKELDDIISNAAVQYIAGLITEEQLREAWNNWAAQGGTQVTAEYNDAYHAQFAD